MSIKKFYINDIPIRPLFDDKAGFELTKSVLPAYFFRQVLKGSIFLVNNDFDLIDSLPFENKINLKIYKVINGVETIWFPGYFYKTDCKFDNDNKKVEISNITTDDSIEDVLNGLNNEYEIKEDLALPINNLECNIRPILQVYKKGDTSLTNFMGANYWETQVDGSTDDSTITDTWFFAQSFLKADVNTKGIVDNTFKGEWTIGSAEVVNYGYDIHYIPLTRGNYKIKPIHYEHDSEGRVGWGIIDTTVTEPDGTKAYYYNGWLLYFNETNGEFTEISGNAVCYDVEFTQITNAAWVYGIFDVPISSFDITSIIVPFEISVFTRILAPKNILYFTDSYTHFDTNLLTTDITVISPRYQYALGVILTNIQISKTTQTEPTIYGMVPTGALREGEYFTELAPIGTYKNQYLCISTWVNYSIWVDVSSFTSIFDITLNYDTFLITECFKIDDIISQILGKINTTIVTSNLSKLLSDGYKIYITLKTNVINGIQKDVTKKHKVKLADLLQLIMDITRSYWRINSSNELQIDYDYFFRNGNSYSGSPSIQLDLTTLLQPKNNKPWSYNKNQYSYQKSQMPERYEFKWMDKQSLGFEGFPIIVNSQTVQLGMVQQIDFGQFSSDLDQMLTASQEINSDGFILIITKDNEIPIVEKVVNNYFFRLQNFYASNIGIHDTFYKQSTELASKYLNINLVDETLSRGVATKTQDIEFPAPTQIDAFGLIKTGLGNGKIDKMSINFSDNFANTTLIYDTE